jgi:glycosyltransferase involved in cell wall biosynthesis
VDALSSIGKRLRPASCIPIVHEYDPQSAMKTRSLRILMVSNKCPPDFDGGFELRAFQIAQALRGRGHEVELVTSCFRETFTGERKDPPWVHRIFRYVPVSKIKGPLRHVERILRLFESTWVAGENVPAMEEFLRGRDFDLAYCFGMLRISFAVAEPIQRRGIPILWHAGGPCIADHFFHFPKRFPGYEIGMRLFTRGWYAVEKRVEFRHVAYVSTFLRDRERERGHVPQNSYIISRGIDFPLATDPGRERKQPPTFFLACRIDPTKGIHHVAAAAGMLHRQRPELAWKIEIAGASFRPHYRAEIEARISREGVRDRLHFLGQLSRAEVIAHMKSATAFIFSSIYGEPFSSTIIESMACGTPLIGADDGSILEVVEPGVSALVYRKAEPAELAALMARVLDDPALAQRVAEAGLETIRTRYTIDRILDLTEQTFQSVIDDQAARTIPATLSPANA